MRSAPRRALLAGWASSFWGMLTLRLLGVLAIVAVLSVLIFGMMYLIPGDLVRTLLGLRPASPEIVAAIREQYRLDDPLALQYTNWLGNALQGDLGTSIRYQVPVAEVIADRIPLTATLAVMAMVIAAVVAIPLGVLAARRHQTGVDRALTGISVVGLSAPAFVVSLLLLYVFAFYLPIFPVYGGGTDFVSRLYYLVLPSIALAVGLGAILMRLTRAAMIESLASDYITFARSRGLSELRVLGLALRNSSIPIITAAGLVFTYVIGGTILVETAFALPGLGLMLQDAVLFKDVALVQALVLLVAVVIALITVAIDLTYAVIDPRVRRGRSAS
jgi:peptide/nickel transport system permease protein